MSKLFIVSENNLILKMELFLKEADSDEIARIAEEMFGGRCFPREEELYEFTPSETYNEMLDDIKEPNSILDILENCSKPLEFIEKKNLILIKIANPLGENKEIWKGTKDEFIKSVLEDYKIRQNQTETNNKI